MPEMPPDCRLVGPSEAHGIRRPVRARATCHITPGPLLAAHHDPQVYCSCLERIIYTRRVPKQPLPLRKHLRTSLFRIKIAQRRRSGLHWGVPREDAIEQ